MITYTTNGFPFDYWPGVFDNYSTNIMLDNKILNVGLWDTGNSIDIVLFNCLFNFSSSTFSAVGSWPGGLRQVGRTFDYFSYFG